MSNNSVYGKEDYKLAYKERNINWYMSTLSNMITLGLQGPVLDLGCGLGFFVETCLRNNIECVGVELSDYGVQKAKERYPVISIIQKDLSDKLPFKKNSFKSVVLNQVVDHLPRNVGIHVFKESYRVLSNEGKLFIYSGCRFNKKESNDPEHLFLYTPSLLKQTLNDIGFDEVKPLDTPLEILGNNIISKRIMKVIFKFFPLDIISASASAVAVK